MFRRDWSYFHPAMSEFKGETVEIRYSDNDYARLWVILPNRQVCEAELITPIAIQHPDKRTLKEIAQADARERRLIREAQMVNLSMLRGESVEDRVAAQMAEAEPLALPLVATGGGRPIADCGLRIADSQTARSVPQSAIRNPQSSVTVLTRLDAPRLRAVPPLVTPQQMAAVPVDNTIFRPRPVETRLREEWEEDDG